MAAASGVGSSAEVQSLDQLSDGNLAAGPNLICGPREPIEWADVDEDILWLARAVYSESKLAAEQELVAWVIRNRVDSQFRGRKTYKDVVLDPFQFSAFNRGYPKRSHYMNLTPRHTTPEWQQTLGIALSVARADSAARPLPLETRHFYSEVSRLDGSPPGWARGRTPVPVTDRQVDPRRFRFFKGVI